MPKPKAPPEFHEPGQGASLTNGETSGLTLMPDEPNKPEDDSPQHAQSDAEQLEARLERLQETHSHLCKQHQEVVDEADRLREVLDDVLLKLRNHKRTNSRALRSAAHQLINYIEDALDGGGDEDA